MIQVMDSGTDHDTKKRIDRNFLSAVQTVSRINKEHGYKPYSDSGISELIGNRRQIIHLIKSADRSVTLEQLFVFCDTFFLSSDWMLKNTDPDTEIHYDVERYANCIDSDKSTHNGSNDNSSIADVFSGNIYGDINLSTSSHDMAAEALKEEVEGYQSHIDILGQTIESLKRQIALHKERIEDLNKLNEALSDELKTWRDTK